jgi:protein phosphatase
MVKAGLINEEQARLSEKSNIITRALGIKSTVEIEITDNLSYQKGDRFMLCTDGICGVIPESELVKMTSEKGNVETVVSNLVEKIDAIGKTHGGKHDNLTAVLIEIDVENQMNAPISNLKKKKSLLQIFIGLLKLKKYENSI